MIVLRWFAFLIGAECLVVLALIPRGVGSMLIAALFFICFLIFCWTIGAFAGDSNNSKGTTP